MSESTGFRVSVFSHLMSKNHKSPSSVYVNTKRFVSIQAFKEHLSILCDVPHGDFDLHCRNNFLPPNEDIRVLKEEDVVLVLPNKWEVPTKRKRPTEIVEEVNLQGEELVINSEVETQGKVPKTKLKRKRAVCPIETPENVQIIVPNKTEKKRKKCVEFVEEECNPSEQKKSAKVNIQDNKTPESLELPANGFSSDKICFFEHLSHSIESNTEKARDSMKQCGLAKCKSFIENASAISVEESPLKDTPTFPTTRKKRTSTPYYQPIGTLLKELKSNNLSNVNECSADVEAAPKKRKRYRKRQRPVKSDVTIIDDSPLPPNHQHFTTHPSTSQPRIHIKFSDDVRIIPNNEDVIRLSTASESMLSAQDHVGEGNSTDSAIEVVEVASSGNGSLGEDLLRRGEGRVTDETIANSPSMKNITPKAGDLIAFKMLRLSESYNPEPSSFITAKTIYYDLLTKSISLQIIEGADQMKLPDGKFSLEMLEGLEEKGQLSEEVTINWDQLIDPKLLYP